MHKSLVTIEITFLFYVSINIVVVDGVRRLLKQPCSKQKLYGGPSLLEAPEIHTMTAAMLQQ